MKQHNKYLVICLLMIGIIIASVPKTMSGSVEHSGDEMIEQEVVSVTQIPSCEAVTAWLNWLDGASDDEIMDKYNNDPYLFWRDLDQYEKWNDALDCGFQWSMSSEDLQSEDSCPCSK